MIKILAKSIRQYKTPSLLAPLFVIGVVIMACIIPYVTANLVNQIKAGCSMVVILRYGLLLVVMMRQFFIGVNNLRDQARAALPGEEKELLFGEGIACK